MPENYEVIYSHPSGATATFVRVGGELDSLAKGLDSEQFWTFKNVKSLLARNDEGDLREAHRLMASIGFAPLVRDISTAPSLAALREEVFAGTGVAEGAHGAQGAHHGPPPSLWPLILGIAASTSFIGLMFVNSTVVITAIGLVVAFIAMIGWGLEEFHVEM